LWFEASPGQNSARPYLKRMSRAWWCKSVALASWEEEVRGLRFEAAPGKSRRPYLKNKLKTKKGWGHGSSDRVPP
jgi:hypothetical protein